MGAVRERRGRCPQPGPITQTRDSTNPGSKRKESGAEGLSLGPAPNRPKPGEKGQESKGLGHRRVVLARRNRWGVCSTYRGRNIRSGGLGFRRGSCQFGVALVAQNFVISKEAGFELTVENGGGYGPPQPLKLRLMVLTRARAL
jgi:hypothetical protein